MRKTLDELKAAQKNFDQTHKIGSKSFYVDIGDSNIQELEHLAVCLSGEFGEFCNIVKKISRGDLTLQTAKAELSEELADTFIYLLKISNQLNIDIEAETVKKIEKNKLRFPEV
ncbi:MazG nucleotide pyrophosphohydrolase domain-containing protein [Pseudomonas sp. efr-133-TYG-103a]|uniref:MazG nucleotide pyrophosphohydrolase domain-containing protein n=1 Tax=Pseudomonas sp. efr-133-TYG-103a TaxID=3040308 RepID=UPI00255458AB|nr:MazG nucleotide pyrophosphohydrolase domain-containing protein [Pseudomonas sp. efr-133-TYG-103a]